MKYLPEEWLKQKEATRWDSHHHCCLQLYLWKLWEALVKWIEKKMHIYIFQQGHIKWSWKHEVLQTSFECLYNVKLVIWYKWVFIHGNIYSSCIYIHVALMCTESPLMSSANNSTLYNNSVCFFTKLFETTFRKISLSANTIN